MGNAIEFQKRSLRMKGPLSTAEMQLLRAEVREKMGEITEIDVEFMSTKIDLDLSKIVSEPITVELDTQEEGTRLFTGHCVEAIYEGTYQGQGHYVATLRSWPWFLTQTADCRIFQDMTAMEIIKEVVKDHGFEASLKDKTSQTFPKRVYCVQYRETDYDFIRRLMVEEGIYYFMKYLDKKDEMVLIDDTSKHENIEEQHVLKFFFKEDGYRRREDHIFDWRDRQRLRTATVTLDDYDFTKPSTDLKAAKTITKDYAKHKRYEVYDYPGRYSEVSRGETLAKIRAEHFSGEYERSRGIGNVRTMAAGHRFTLSLHPRTSANKTYLVTEAIHQLQIETDFDKGELKESVLGQSLEGDWEKFLDPYKVIFRAQPSTADFRLSHDTPRPRIPGLQTAVVQGPSGKEIYTDKYGRVKVKFHWDRNPANANPEALTCWIRTAVPWSGKNWGMVWVPRVGQEVVVQFEEGDPDRPLIVGMLYNEETKHPYTLDANMTMMGWTTRSTEKGKTDTFHELVFEDKIKEEYVRFQSERDYKQIVKNNAEITVGLEHKDKGDYSLTVQNDMTETVKEGNHTFTVETGNREVSVAGDHTETVEGSQTVDVTGEISITSAQKITLTVGGSSITIDSSSIKFNSTNIECTASAKFKATGTAGAEISSSANAKVAGAMVDIGGQAMTKVQGGICKIN